MKNRIRLEKLVTIREGYVAENQQRLITGGSPAYTEGAFFELAEMIGDLLIDEDEP